jgi:hypothetical protein
MCLRDRLLLEGVLNLYEDERKDTGPENNGQGYDHKHDLGPYAQTVERIPTFHRAAPYGQDATCKTATTLPGLISV